MCARFAVVALFACALVSAATHPARAQGSGTSTGGSTVVRGRGSLTVRVVDDANQPVQNAVVMAIGQGRSSRLSYDNTMARSGKYVVGNLEPGLYRVNASAPGYVQESLPSVQDFNFSALASDPTLYRPGDAVTIRLTKGGVVTGRVTDADGNAVVGARISALRVRDLDGRGAQDSGVDLFRPRERRTDDRGIYRLYGLKPGAYVVFAGGKPQFNFTGRPTAYDGDAPTYYPSSPRDGAIEVQVQTGQELTDIDIRYRGDKGHSVGGTIIGGGVSTGQPGSGFAFVTLTHAATGALESQAFVQPDSLTRAFSFDGVADGEYELTATSPVQNENSLLSIPQHVIVRGADVAGLRLTLVALGSLAGRVAFEPLKAADAAKTECQTARAFAPQELLVFTRGEGNDAAQRASFSAAETSPDAKGEFTLRNLRDGRRRFGVRLVDDNYYIRSLTLPSNAPATPTPTNARGATPTPATIDLARNGFTLKSGDKLTGALVQISAGAVSLRGRVAAAEGEQVPEGLRVYLVPSERERAEDVLRYGESDVQTDGSFVFKNLAPGNYFLLARPAPETDQRQARLALDANARAALRRDAEAAKNSVTLQPCQRAADFTLRLTKP
jgi:protocatechuate 3,4-dioxygenase beta subunit